MRLYTSFYWLDVDVWRTAFEAESDGDALREHEQLGPSAYDDRLLLSGDVSLEALAARISKGEVS